MKKLLIFMRSPVGAYARTVFIQRLVGVMLYLLGSGWRMGQQALLYFTVYLLGSFSSFPLILRAVSREDADRMPVSAPQGRERILSALGIWLGCFVLYFVAGLERRGGRPTEAIAFYAGMTLTVLSGALSVAAARADLRRSVKNMAVGVYAAVRCPNALAGLLWAAGTVLVFQTPWAAISAVGYVCVLIVQTAWEDKRRKSALRGYISYAARVKYRLLPPLW